MRNGDFLIIYAAGYLEDSGPDNYFILGSTKLHEDKLNRKIAKGQMIAERREARLQRRESKMRKQQESKI